MNESMHSFEESNSEVRGADSELPASFAVRSSVLSAVNHMLSGDQGENTYIEAVSTTSEGEEVHVSRSDDLGRTSIGILASGGSSRPGKRSERKFVVATDGTAKEDRKFDTSYEILRDPSSDEIALLKTEWRDKVPEDASQELSEDEATLLLTRIRSAQEGLDNHSN